MRTVLHLVANLGMSEAEIMDASFRSRHIIRRTSADMNGQYRPNCSRILSQANQILALILIWAYGSLRRFSVTGH